MTATKRPNDCGLHFFIRALMKLVEVIRTIVTADDVLERVRFGAKLGKFRFAPATDPDLS